MWSDDLDNKIKEATEGYHPAYDDKAWDKMEPLLNKHLPQEKRRRRFIFLLLPLLLAGTGIFIVFQKQGKNGISEEKNTTVKSQAIKIQPEQGTGITPSKTTASNPSAIPAQQNRITPGTEEENRSTKIKSGKRFSDGGISNTDLEKPKQVINRGQKFKQQPSGHVKYNDKTKARESDLTAKKTPEQNTSVTLADKSPADNIVTPVSGNKDDLPQITKAAEEKKQPDSSETKEIIAETKPRKQRSSAAGKLSLSLSAGPDISSVGIDNPGKWELQYGIGLSYAVSKQLSIRTGFFTGHKKYSADSTEYSANYYPPNLQKIEANCLVYEIPVNLIYNFPAVKKHNWFIAGGLSSYLMKKETYNYFYKNAWGQPQYYSHTYKNQNSHIFSVINISGGYQYHFTDRLFMIAEPYVRIPVSGIGSGKVKLNSGGILFSLGFKPFLKKN